MAPRSSTIRHPHTFNGCIVSITARSEDRYEGFFCDNDTHNSSVALRDAKYYGTEGRRMDGPQIPPSDRVYPWLFFRRNEIKRLELLPYETDDLPSAVHFVTEEPNPHPADARMSIVPSTAPPFGFPQLPQAQLAAPQLAAPQPNHVPNTAPNSVESEIWHPVVGPNHARRGVFVSDEVLMERLTELLDLMKAKILGPGSSSASGSGSNSSDAQGPGC